MALVGSTNIALLFLPSIQSLRIFVFNKLNGVLSPIVTLSILDFLPKIQLKINSKINKTNN